MFHRVTEGRRKRGDLCGELVMMLFGMYGDVFPSAREHRGECWMQSLSHNTHTHYMTQQHNTPSET